VMRSRAPALLHARDGDLQHLPRLDEDADVEDAVLLGADTNHRKSNVNVRLVLR
jgi:hypothetical protein